MRFIQRDEISTANWTEDAFYVTPALKPQHPLEAIKASRTSNPIFTAYDVDEFAEQVRQLQSISPVQDALFASMIEQFRGAGGIPASLRCRVRSSRVTFFDERPHVRGNRIARMEIPRKQPDVLVLTEIVERWRHAFEKFHPAPHDKGPHMRRFRLGEIEDARQFGGVLVHAILMSFESA